MMYKDIQHKRASALSDSIAAAAPLVYPPVGLPISALGAAHGLVARTQPTEEENMDKNPGQAFVPGVGASRLARRLKRQLVTPSKDSTRQVSSTAGALTSGLLSTGLGAGIGALMGGKGGAVTGAAVGFGAPILLAAGLAALRRTRTPEEQQRAAANKDKASLDMFVPGHALYNLFKSLGRSEADIEEREARRRQFAAYLSDIEQRLKTGELTV